MTEQAYKRTQWGRFFLQFETYIEAIITDKNSDYVEDSVYKMQLRDKMIDSLMNREFDIP
jgi:hypothetical protein